jgi:ComEC/Rec2-related protein
MYVSFATRATVPLTAVLQGTVVDQRSVDTRVVEIWAHELLVRSNQRDLSVGDLIAFEPYLTPAAIPSLSREKITMPTFWSDEFAFDRRLASKSYLAWGSVSPAQVMVISTHQEKLSFIGRLRYLYKEYIQEKFGSTTTAALLLGLTTGDRSWFSREIYTSFVESGLVHLLAVSGSNIVYVSLLLGIVFFWLPFYLRLVLIGGGLVIYGLFCGADSSVVRAISMGILWLLATWMWRPVDVWRLLQITAGGMLVLNPLVLWYDLWFLLSFWAVMGILVVSTWYRQGMAKRKQRRFDTFLLWRLMPTVGATAGVLPVLILRTGKISLSSIWINLIVVPLVPVFLVIGGIAAIRDVRWWAVGLLDRMSTWLLWFASRWSTEGLFLFVSPGVSRLVFVGMVALAWSFKDLRLKI